MNCNKPSLLIHVGPCAGTEDHPKSACNKSWTYPNFSNRSRALMCPMRYNGLCHTGGSLTCTTACPITSGLDCSQQRLKSGFHNMLNSRLFDVQHSLFFRTCFCFCRSCFADFKLVPKKRFKASCNKTGTPNPPNLQKCLQGWLYILCALFYNAQHHLRILISVRHYCDADRTWRPQVHLEIWMARDIPVQASCKTMSIVSWSHSLKDMTCKATFDAWPDRCNNALRGWGKHMNMLTNPVVDGNRWHHRQAQA